MKCYPHHDKIAEYVGKGMTYIEMGKRLHINRTTIQNYCEKYILNTVDDLDTLT